MVVSRRRRINLAVIKVSLLPFWRVSSWDGFSASWRTPCRQFQPACQRSDDALLSTCSVCRGAVLSNFVLNRLVMKNLFQENRSTGKCIFPGVYGSCLRLAGRYDLVCRSGIQSDCVWSGGYAISYGLGQGPQ